MEPWPEEDGVDDTCDDPFAECFDEGSDEDPREDLAHAEVQEPQRRTQPLRPHDGMPKWIGFSSIQQAWGRKASVPRVYLAIMRFDHQTIGLDGRRDGDGLWSFRVMNADIAQVAGTDVKTVGRAAEELLDLDLLEVYEHGRGTTWSTYRVNRDRLLHLYSYAAPRLRRVHGGIHNVPDDGDAFRVPTVVYGLWRQYVDLPEPMMLQGEEIRRLWQTRPPRPQWPDPATVASLLGVSAGVTSRPLQGDRPSPPEVTSHHLLQW